LSVISVVAGVQPAFHIKAGTSVAEISATAIVLCNVKAKMQVFGTPESFMMRIFLALVPKSAISGLESMHSAKLEIETKHER
jgi:hypothetical protein